MSEGRWEPLLDGGLASRAREAARAIADSLATATVEPEYAGHVALFWAYAAGVWDDDATQGAYDAAVDRLVERVGAGYELRSLFGGLAGDGWVLCHVGGDGDALAMFDDALLEALAPAPWTAPYDLVEGLVGYGVYFLERLLQGHAPARAGLARVVEHLAALHAHAAGGVTWRTPVEQIPLHQQAAAPDGYYNCGLAHGVPGAIALLAKILEHGELGRARHLLDGAVTWLWKQQLPPSPQGRFPSWVIPGQLARPTRTAWCYGDPGVALALWGAAARAGAGSLDDARALARETATREVAAAQIVDAGLCHGATGMGHVLNRWFHASGEAVFRDAACAWFERALAYRQPGTGLGGFQTPPPGGAPGTWTAHAGLLEGAAGMGLALLAAIGDAPPDWDRLLLCDLPEPA